MPKPSLTALLALGAALLLGLLASVLWSPPRLHPALPGHAVPVTAVESVHLALGAPTDADPSDDTLIVRPEYVVSYNRPRHGANWSAWRIEGADLGREERYSGQFLPDPSLPAAEQVTHADYAASGFDRGHLAPSGDRTATAAAQTATFYLGNVLPQRPALNRGPWESLEKYHRRLAREGHRVFVTAGPLWGERTATLGQHAVPIPAFFWKVAVVVCGTCGPEAVDASTPVMAVVMPNEEHVASRWMTYQTTLAEVERRSGYQLLSKVPAPVRIHLETEGAGR